MLTGASPVYSVKTPETSVLVVRVPAIALTRGLIRHHLAVGEADDAVGLPGQFEVVGDQASRVPPTSTWWVKPRRARRRWPWLASSGPTWS